MNVKLAEIPQPVASARSPRRAPRDMVDVRSPTLEADLLHGYKTAIRVIRRENKRLFGHAEGPAA